MQKYNNLYWYKEMQNSKLHVSFKFLFALIALLALFAFGLKPAFSESKSNVALDTILPESPSGFDLPNISEEFLNNENISDPTGNNNASISDGEVSVQINDSSRADTSQSDSNISISIKNSNTSESENTPDNTVKPTIVINGEEVEIQNSGRVRQTLRDDNSTTRLRTDIDSDGTSSISINASSN